MITFSLLTDNEDDDEDRIFSLRPIQDEWRQLFDRYDPEGFGEIPLDDFVKALDSRDFLQAISPGKLIILQDKALQLRQLHKSAITFQDFVNTLSSKRTLSFKCAMHSRDKLFVSNTVEGLLGGSHTSESLEERHRWQRSLRFARKGLYNEYPIQTFSESMSRSSSVYTIVDKFMSTVANETLTDGRDRKYFLDSHRVPGNGYRGCFSWPLAVPLFIPVLSLLQISIQAGYSFSHAKRGKMEDSDNEKIEQNILVFHPHRLEEPWRYLTYFLIHLDWLHLLVNMSMQLLLGVPLELVHGVCRIVFIYLAGVLSGSVAASIFDSSVLLAGCGGGVYALLSAHLANVLLHHESMANPYLRLIGLLFLASMEVGFGVYRRYAPTTQEWMKIGFVAQLAGIVAGLTIGLVVLRNYEQKLGERAVWWIAIAVLLLLTISVFLYHGLNKNKAFTLFCTTPDC